MPDGQYTDAQLSDGTTLRFQGQLGPDQVRSKVQDYKLKTGSGMGAGNVPDTTNALNKVQQSPTGEKLGGRIATDPQELAAHRKTENEIGNTYAGAVGAMIPGVGAEGGIGSALMKIGRVGLGGLGGSMIGKHYGGTPGAIVGGIAGGGLAGGMERDPYTARVNGLPFGLQKFIPDWMVPTKIPKPELERGAFMNRGYQSMAEEPRVAIPGTESEGRYATIEGNRLREMAPKDPAAIRQLNQRGVRIPMLTEGKPLIHTGEFGGIQVPENTISGRKIIIPPPQ